MSKLDQLRSKVKKFKDNVFHSMDAMENELDEANRVLAEASDITDLSEIFTVETAPERIKDLPVELRDVWIKTFNSVFADSKDEKKAFRVANAQIAKMKEVNLKEDELREAVWTTEFINDLPDSSFAVISSGGKKDASGKTVPRSLRHLPFKDASGKIDLPHLRNALARLSQTKISSQERATAKSKLDAAAKQADIGEARGQGQGVGGARQGDGGTDQCVCPKCGATISHTRGTPCTQQKCPKCGASMIGKIKEAMSLFDELKENGIKITKAAKNMDLNLAEFISLKEAKFDETTGDVEVVLIEQGTNINKKRHYPDSTIREAASRFGGLKMYLNHPTRTEDKERPERDLRDWVSTIIESHYEDGKAIGKVSIHDGWLRDRLKDSVAREHIGLSINTSGQISYGKIQGQEMQIVEKIIMQRQNGPASVDWVTEAGARGKVSRLLKESNERGKKMELNEATMEDLKRENPELVESLVKEVKDSMSKSKETEIKEKELKESREKLANLEKKEKISKQKEAIAGLMEGKEIAQPVKDRIVESLSETVFENETKLKEAFEAKLKSELEYVNKISGKGKIKTGSSENTGSLSESLGNELDSRAGIKKEKDGDDE